MTVAPARRRALAEALRLFGLGAVVFAGWASVFDKWTPASLGRPIGYCLDGMLTHALVKAGSDFGFVPVLSKVNHHLGAPFAASWNDFPISEDHIFFFWGMVARLVGVVAALNLAFLGCAVGSAFALYGVARWLRLRWEAAFVAGALYGLAPFLFYRSVHHFTLINYWHVPLFVPLWLWVGGRRGLAMKGRRFGLALGIAALAGSQNVYYLNYFLQILGLCVLAQLVRRRWRKAAAGGVLVAVAMAAFLVVNLDTIWARYSLGPNLVAVQRSVAEVEVYGLRPIELLTPGYKHRIPAFARVGEHYKASALTVGEFPSPYLGIVGALAFLWLLFHTVATLLLGRPAGWARFGLYAVWLIGTAIPGGGMQLFQKISGLVLFRSNNRASIFLLMFALLFLARMLSLLPTGWPRWALAPIAALLLAIGVYDQTPSSRIDPNVPHWETVAQREVIAVSDEHLVAELEKRVPPGTMVFQLPQMQFPEAGFLGRLPDYDQFRPYLFSKTLRWSYGNMKGRPEADWQNEMASLPGPMRIAALEQKGFGAIYILKNGYPPYEVAAMLAELNAAGRGETIESEYGDSVVVLLHPAAH